MEMAMNELEAMKSTYKKVLKGQQASLRSTMSQRGRTESRSKAESERSTSHLEKTMGSYSNFSSRKKEPKILPNDELRMNRLNKL
jgi:hypothetical protein